MKLKAASTSERSARPSATGAYPDPRTISKRWAASCPAGFAKTRGTFFFLSAVGPAPRTAADPSRIAVASRKRSAFNSPNSGLTGNRGHGIWETTSPYASSNVGGLAQHKGIEESRSNSRGAVDQNGLRQFNPEQRWGEEAVEQDRVLWGKPPASGR